MAQAGEELFEARETNTRLKRSQAREEAPTAPESPLTNHLSPLGSLKNSRR